MHCGNAAAMPPARKEATLSFCQASRSVRITTAILLSNCMMAPASFRGWSEGPYLRYAIAHRGISRFRVRCGACHRAALRADPLASPRNDDYALNQPLASPVKEKYKPAAVRAQETISMALSSSRPLS